MMSMMKSPSTSPTATYAPPLNVGSNAKKLPRSAPVFPSMTEIRADPPNPGAVTTSSTPSWLKSPVATRTPPVNDVSYGNALNTSNPFDGLNTLTSPAIPSPDPTAYRVADVLVMRIVTVAVATSPLVVSRAW